MSAAKRRRVLLSLGPGTLPSQGRDRLDFTDYNARLSGKPTLTGREMVAALPEIDTFADIVFDDEGPHPQATHEDIRKLARFLDDAARRDDLDGIVWVQGTNTLEETAFFLNLTVRSRKPVVVVGAQRPFTALSTDAHLNLVNAMRVAACDEAAGMGVLVVTNSEIIAARDVTKTSTYQVQTFRGRDLGVLGYADPDRVVLYHAAQRRHTIHSEFDITRIDRLPMVEILYPHTGANPGLARAAVDLGATGLVIAGVGAGALGVFTEAVKALVADGVVIVRSARVGEGRVLATGNNHEEGTIAADNLNPQKAAVLLALALTRTRDTAEVQRIFDEY
jgi:L-asparaginase type II